METDWMHRAPIPRPNPGERLQTILVRFLHSANTELILCTARNKSELTWEGNCSMIFPNFSWATQVKRDKFRDCKKALWEFALLRIDYNRGQKRFDDPKKAMEYIQEVLV